MSPGLQAVVSFSNEQVCPVVAFASNTDTCPYAITRSARPAGCPDSITEFSINHEKDLTRLTDSLEFEVDIEQLFSSQTVSRIRLTHSTEMNCPCMQLGLRGCSPSRYEVSPEHLEIEFYVGEYDELKDIISQLREEFPSMILEKVLRSESAHPPLDDFVVIDRSVLTDRQEEVIETAFSMGYFERPRRANGQEIAKRLEIHPTTFSEHLTAAQTNLLRELL